MTQSIHPTAIIDPAATLGSAVVIGPFCVVGADVVLADGVRLHSHVVVEGRTRIGAGTQIFPFASIGHAPQDLKFHGEPSELIIGANNRIREHVTMNPGTEGGGMVTRVGDNCLFMMASHVAHDCVIGNNVILANNATLGGHVHVGDHAILGGLSAVHQFVRIGAHAMIGGMSGVEQDVIPFGLVMGERARLNGLNLIGLQRRGFGKEDIRALRAAYKALFSADKTLAERVEQVGSEFGEQPVVGDILSFIRADASRPLCQPRAEHAS
ncbi:UDP-N-acetylglucosamine acyltransferase [Skermanella stibiiresistens SB22]|uniref:Acyl-[acyl-carrier-protein]--UDP-N-acetylglucosamine O-acyltransferase n=1 Tax=Skermanella stibiiresistens SB22 TaxID=1385369 RepID=W9H822_9PROT|nr:acyl-ACP--UDP-N-acetylglucosamine O-acyltransferase [Skermanella stibiiresistens]EWY42149.1 UDP-N-acetylglucosamine acyltransferase [Skermanella stibiiresistens SB22]